MYELKPFCQNPACSRSAYQVPDSIIIMSEKKTEQVDIRVVEPEPSPTEFEIRRVHRIRLHNKSTREPFFMCEDCAKETVENPRHGF